MMSKKIWIVGFAAFSITTAAAVGYFYKSGLGLDQAELGYHQSLEALNAHLQQQNLDIRANNLSLSRLPDGERLYAITRLSAANGEADQCMDLETTITVDSAQLMSGSMAASSTNIIHDPTRSNCRWTEKLANDAEAQEIFQQLGGRVPLQLTTQHRINGEHLLTLQSDAIEVYRKSEDADYRLEPATLNVNVKSPEAIRFDFDWPGFTADIRDPKDDIGYLRLKTISGSGDQHKLTENIWTGTFDLGIETINFKHSGDEFSGRFRLESKGQQADPGFLDQEASLTFVATQGGKDLGEVGYQVKMRNMQLAALDALTVALRNPAIERFGSPESTQALNTAIEQAQKTFANSMLEIPVHYTLSGERADIAITLTSENLDLIGSELVQANPVALISALKLEIDGSFSEQLLKNVFLAFPSGKSVSFPAVQQQLAQLEQQGLLINEGNGTYSVKIRADQQTTAINQNEVPTQNLPMLFGK